MTIKNEIRNFVVVNFLFGDAASLNDDASFIDSGIVDSTGILELIAFLEDTYNTRIEPDELVPENFDSVNRVVEFLARKQTVQVGS